MEYILFAGVVILLISVGYFLMDLFGLVLERALRYAAKKIYRRQTREAIAEVLGRSLG
jgi:hypothetical protein